MFKNISLVLFALTTSVAFASEKVDNWYTIDDSSLQIEEVSSGQLTNAQIQDMIGDCSNAQGSEGLQQDGMSMGELINYGLKIWQVVLENKPVVNVTEMSANALPRGFSCWTELEKWQAPQYKSYKVSYSNLLGVEIVSFRFQMFYSYGGKVNGKGSYLANVAVRPMNVDVMWGFQFDANVEVGQILNMGSHEDPVAGMEMAIKWTTRSPLKESRGQVRYFVSGDGSSEQFH